MGFALQHLESVYLPLAQADDGVLDLVCGVRTVVAMGSGVPVSTTVARTGAPSRHGKFFCR